MSNVTTQVNHESPIAVDIEPPSNTTTATTPDGTPLDEIAAMRQTIALFTELMRKQDSRLTALESKFTEHVPESLSLLPRFALSSERNSRINLPPRVIAYASHLRFIKNVPGIQLVEHGLISLSRMRSLNAWDKQHLLDYCEINNVLDVYEHGLPDDEARELVPDWEGLQAYLSGNDEKAPKPPHKLDKALKHVNEQKAERIDFTG